MAKIISLWQHKNPVNRGVKKCMLECMKSIRAGDCSNVAIMYQDREGVTHTAASFTNHPQGIGGIEWLKRNVMQQWEDGD